jgi:RNA polymerase sigma factor (sigma-70 family)
MTEAAVPDRQSRSISQARRPGGPPRLLSDDRLARRAAQGDQRAFEEIYRRYHQDLYRFCLATLGNPQDAQDALQNTMVKVLRALPGEERRIQLKPWLYRIARNEAVETVRRRRDSAEIEADRTASPEQVAETAEMRERLRRLIADLGELPERQRAALVMRELAGLAFAQIGEAFESSAAVARQTVYEARLSLRQMEEGREMGCELVMRELSDADGRVTRRRELRAHLRGCASCRAFRDSMAARRGDLAAIAPLPLALSAGMLHGIFSGNASAAVGGGAGAAAGAGAAGASGAGAGGGLATAVGAGAGKAVATSAILKAAATVAVVATVGATAADRSGMIDVPVLGGAAKPSQAPATNGSTPGAGSESASGEGVETGGQGKAAGGGTQRAGSRHAAASGRKAHRAGPSAHARSTGRNASHAGQQGHAAGLPAASSDGQGTAASHQAAARHAKRHPDHASRRHASRRSHRSRPPRHSSHHTAPPPKAAKEDAAPAPTSSPASSKPAGTDAAERPGTGVE